MTSPIDDTNAFTDAYLSDLAALLDDLDRLEVVEAVLRKEYLRDRRDHGPVAADRLDAEARIYVAAMEARRPALRF